MSDTFKLLLGFLEQNNLKKAAKVLREELDAQDKAKTSQIDQETSKNLLKIINRAITNQTHGDIRNKLKDGTVKQDKPPIKLFTAEETENIMEKFMNRLVAKPNLLEDENLNAKIERFFDNSTFKNMVDNIDVFQDISNVSFTNSMLNKNKPSENKDAKTAIADSSYENSGVPKFGKTAENGMVMGEESVITNNHAPQTKSTLPNNPVPSIKIDESAKMMEKSPSMGDIFDNMDMSTNKNPYKNLNGEKTPPFEKIIDPMTGKLPSMIEQQEISQSSFLQNTSLLLPILEENIVDEYTDDDDPGFDLYEVAEKDFPRVSKQLADKYDFPNRAMTKDKNPQSVQKSDVTNDDESEAMLKEIQDNKKDSQDQTKDPNNTSKSQKKPKGYIYLPPTLKQPPSNDDFYPVEYDNVIYDCFSLKVIFDRERTGFEESKDFPIVINSIIAGRYQIVQYLGSAAFSKAIQCLDLTNNQMVCMKIIENNKDYFDQSIDEIKLLKFINYNGDVDEKNVLKVYDFFYHKEHLFIITELLKDNLYEFSKFNRENETEPYFTIGRLQKVTKQILIALDYIHSLNLIHCDLKPENILMRSYSRCEIKVIDFGSSCFIHDHLSSYVQSRSYRAPEVIIGCKYDFKIDMWSLGCIIAELWTGNVLFQNDTVQGLLARVIGIIGPFPEKMMREGRLISNFFTKEKLLYQEPMDEGNQSQGYLDNSDPNNRRRQRTGKVQILVPKKSSLKHRLRTNDGYFYDFVRRLLEIDPSKRPTAKEAMNHPWFIEAKYPEVPYQPKNVAR